MKLTPFQIYLNSLAHGPVRFGYLSREEALDRLRKLTGEDFGLDVSGWKNWAERHPELAFGRIRTTVRRNRSQSGDVGI